ncbi:MAG: UDP-N-acetylmuramoyl-tripeptide--D-alanyl-D-alanine ligase [Bacteroidales bacterium]|nr:UDP-N-acetylmuramoyl-tripeptide--D-alanyl-D-alanine ligase [Bacteroidales bacterium]
MKTIEKIYQYYSQKYLVSTDSRKIEEGCVFVALKGERFDGNDFAYQVAEDGIAACVIADRKDLPQHERLFIVDDSLTTLQELAKMHREKCETPIIGITGTNGKTTTKELVSAVLSKKYDLIYTQGNFNNHLGVPLTLLRIKPETEMAVVEMGANHPGEIAQLCSIAQPDFGIITNIGKAHIEGFGSFEGVIKTKKELYDYLRDIRESRDIRIFVNKDNTILVNISEGLSSFTYGKENADVNVTTVSSNPYLTVMWDGREIRTNLVGDYNLENAAAAIAVGCHFNIDKEKIVKALEEYRPTNNRSQFIKSEKNEIVMDAYNANPTSMQHSLRNFKNISGDNSMLILGDMKELGKESESEHKIIVELIEELGFKDVILVGSEFMKVSKESYKNFTDVEALAEYLSRNTIDGKKILIKGSNSIHLEKLINIL